MTMIKVTPSGTIGKQVYAANTTSQVTVKGFSVSPSGANTTLKIRDGNASGDVVFWGRFLSANGTKDIGEEAFCHKFTKGMHVNVTGTLAEAYLNIE